MAYDVAQLWALFQHPLDDLFRAGPSGEISDGQASGKQRLIDFCLQF